MESFKTTQYLLALMLVFIVFPIGGAVYHNFEIVSRCVNSPDFARRWIPASIYFELFPAIVFLLWFTLWFFILKLPSNARKLLLIAQFMVLLVYVSTAAYFVPTLAKSTGGAAASLSDEEIRSTLTQWRKLDWVRQIIGFTGMCFYVAGFRKVGSLQFYNTEMHKHSNRY